MPFDVVFSKILRFHQEWNLVRCLIRNYMCDYRIYVKFRFFSSPLRMHANFVETAISTRRT